MANRFYFVRNAERKVILETNSYKEATELMYQEKNSWIQFTNKKLLKINSKKLTLEKSKLRKKLKSYRTRLGKSKRTIIKSISVFVPCQKDSSFKEIKEIIITNLSKATKFIFKNVSIKKVDFGAKYIIVEDELINEVKGLQDPLFKKIFN